MVQVRRSHHINFAVKDLKAAEEYYQRVLEVDYEYRDTVTRLDALQSQDGTTS